MKLEDFGYSYYLEKLGIEEGSEPVARVLTENKTDWDLVTKDGPATGIVLTSFRRHTEAENLPKVGDFITYEPITGDKKVKIVSVLPRTTQITRIAPEKRKSLQVLATNVDKMFVIIGSDQDLNTSQVGRYLALSQQSGVEPIIAVNKIDRGPEFLQYEAEIRKIFPNIPLINTSAKTKVGLDLLLESLPAHQTAIFTGSSGAGKSSIINALLDLATGNELATSAVGRHGKGRHTTTKRSMVKLPSGGIIIDTPGIRTLEITDTLEAANSLFPDLDELAQECKFRDCDHQKSQGCAIVAALEAGDIRQDQYEGFMKLRQDTDRLEAKTNIRKHRQQRAKVKSQQKGLRQAYKTRKPAKK